jgi:hypothetical protein
VGTASGLWVRHNLVQFLARARDFLLSGIEATSGAYPVLCSLGAGDKAARA